jgi:hypothetical protein
MKMKMKKNTAPLFGVWASGQLAGASTRPPVGRWALDRFGGQVLVVKPSGQLLLAGKSVTHHQVRDSYRIISGGCRIELYPAPTLEPALEEIEVE